MSIRSRVNRLEGIAHTGEESAKSQALQEAEEAFRQEIASCSLEELDGLLAVLEDLEAQQDRGVEYPEARVPEWLKPRWERNCELWEAAKKAKTGG